MSGKSAVLLKKGHQLSMEKTPLIRAVATWSSDTDYDLYALVLKRNGEVEAVATFGASEGGIFRKKRIPAQASVLNGAVRHLGDIGREAKGDARETIEIRMTSEILAVIPVAYSAQSNGTGSFFRYRVSLEIDNGAGDRVVISSENANDNDTVYTCAIGIIENKDQGVLIHALEQYSAEGSENRPMVELGKDGQIVVLMDRGPRNDYK
jgi:tellurite resistance protein TerA